MGWGCRHDYLADSVFPYKYFAYLTVYYSNSSICHPVLDAGSRKNERDKLLK